VLWIEALAAQHGCTPADLALIDAAMPAGAAAGRRYPAGGMKGVDV